MSVRKPFAILLLLLSTQFTTQAQVKTDLQAYIANLHNRFDAVFSFDVELTKNVPLFADTSHKSLKSALAELNEKTAFHFEFLNAKNVLVKPKAAGQNFILSGIVFDKVTKEPLLGSLIYQSHARYGTYAMEDGTFYKAIIYNESDSIIISSIGYEKMIVPLNFFSGGNKKIELQSQRIQMNEVAVTAYLTTGVSYDASDNSITIRPKNLSILPGSVNGDVLGSLDALPGISSTDGKAGNLNIRGSSPDQTQVNVDQIPVYMKGHYFGTISPINPNAVNQIDVQRSTMSVNKGGRAGGLIDIQTSNAVTNKLQGTLSSSAMDGNVYLHVPVLKDKLSIAVSGRHSYPYNQNNPALKPVSDFIFQRSEIRPLLEGTGQEKLNQLRFDYTDANAKVNYNLSAKHKGNTSFLYISNYMFVDRESRATNLQQDDKIHMHNWGANTSVNSAWSPRINSFLSVTHSYYRQTFGERQTNYQQDSIRQNSLYENRAVDSRLLFEMDFKLSSSLAFKAGYDGRIQEFTYLRATNNNTINTSFQQSFRNSGTVHSAYTTLSGPVLKKLFMNIGLRANYYTINGAYSFEPRAFINYSVNDFFRLKASGGIQKQFVVQITGVSIESIGGLENQLWMLADEKAIPAVNSFQSAFGGIMEKNSWLIDVEAYYRSVNNVTSISLTTPLREKPFIHGNINTVGTDLLVRKQWKAADAWISYTYGESRMQFDSINNGASFTSIYDQTHILDIAGSYRIKQWKFSLGWKYRTGLASLGDIRTRMLSGAPSGAQPQQPPLPPPGQSPPPKPATPTGYTGRFPDYHQLDASVYYMFPKDVKKYKGSVGISVLNCYNQENIIEQSPQGRTMSYRIMPEFSPNLFVTLSF